ncbi:MAG TPA: c-type cytochrome [Xanthobacteraceae bacterium]
MLGKVLTGLCAVIVAAGIAAAQTPHQRGSYLVNSIGACGNCHTPRQQGVPDLTKQLSGGFQTFDEPWFTVKGANITPDKETGIGNWDDADLRKVLLTGVRPNLTPLAPVMPYLFYRVMMPSDIDAIMAYLRSVPPIRNEVQPPTYKVSLVGAWRNGADRPMTADDLKDPVKRGLYLSSIAHCMACHSRASEAVPFDLKNNYGRGGREFRGPWGVSVTANISSSAKGLGAWTDGEIRRALTEGESRDGHRLKPPMVDYVAYYKTWTPDDMDALIAWIRTIPPIE